jgi:hypothetical protein
LSAVIFLLLTSLVPAQPERTLEVRVRGRSGPVDQAEVRAAGVTAITNAEGRATLSVPAGNHEVVISRFGFATAKLHVTVPAAGKADVTVELEEESVITEDVVVTATRTNQRVQDLPGVSSALYGGSTHRTESAANRTHCSV